MIPIVPYIPPGDNDSRSTSFGLVIFILSLLIGMGGMIAFLFFPGIGSNFYIIMIFVVILLFGMIPVMVILSTNHNRNYTRSKLDQRRSNSSYRPDQLHWSSQMNANIKNYCSSCGSNVGDRDLYCMECGARLG